MRSRNFNQAVAQVTGEDFATIVRRGFSPYDPVTDICDDDFPIIDWDALELQRTVLFPTRHPGAAVA